MYYNLIVSRNIELKQKCLVLYVLGLLTWQNIKFAIFCWSVHFSEIFNNSFQLSVWDEWRNLVSIFCRCKLTLRNHVGQDVQFPSYWGHMFPVCRGYHQWIYQHFRVSLLVLMWVFMTLSLPLSWTDGASDNIVPLCRIHNDNTLWVTKQSYFNF